MISFRREGTSVVISFETGMYNFKVVESKIECSNAMFAELLVNQLEAKFDKTTQKVRKIEYKRGRRHAKKSDWFKYGLDDEEYKPWDL